MIEIHRMDPHRLRPGIIGTHQIPRITADRLISGIPEIRPQQDAWNIQHFGDHELHHGSGIEIRSVKIEQSQMTAHDQFQIAVPDTGVAKLSPLGILRQDRPVKAPGNVPDGVAQQQIAGKMLEVEKIPRMIDIHSVLTEIMRFQFQRSAVFLNRSYRIVIKRDRG